MKDGQDGKPTGRHFHEMKCSTNEQKHTKEEREIIELCLSSHAKEEKGMSLSLSVDLDEALLEVSVLYQEIMTTDICGGA